MQRAFRTMMRGELPDSLVAALLVRLPTKNLTVAELTSATQVVREFLIPVNAHCAQPPIDLCGTGGDSQGTFNVSTTASFVAAAGAVMWPNTATAVLAQVAAAPTCWRPLALTWH